MSFCSFSFLLFLPVVALLFWLSPPRLRGVVLLVANGLYMAGFGAGSLAVLGAVTTLTWCCGRGIAAASGQGMRRMWLVLGLAASAGYLFARKLVELTHPSLSLVAAVGLAFYALQAASWLIDTYTGRCPVRPDLLRYALYITFFPRVLSGPIGRAAPFFPQLDALLAGDRPFDTGRARQALTTLLCGYAEKLLLADVLALPVNTVYADLSAYGGAVRIVATALYALSLYFDFAGYSHIAIGAAGLLGVELAPNFRRPFLAGTMAEFWDRWHISLSTWLRDYIYFPLGGSRRGRVRKYVNLMVTFLVSGLWHGAAWKYLLWGAFNAALQIIGDATRPLRPAHRWMWWRRLCVFAGFVFTLFFFRADSAAAALGICVSVFTDLRLAELINGTLLNLGLTGTELAFALAALALLLVLALAAEQGEEQGITLYDRFRMLAAPLRTAAMLALTVLVLLFACRMVGADASGFYYAAF